MFINPFILAASHITLTYMISNIVNRVYKFTCHIEKNMMSYIPPRPFMILRYGILVQAMALGVPVIARDIPGNTAIITDRQNGLLFADQQVRFRN